MMAVTISAASKQFHRWVSPWCVEDCTWTRAEAGRGHSPGRTAAAAATYSLWLGRFYEASWVPWRRGELHRVIKTAWTGFLS
jgi:hypothetical protein